VLERPYQLSAGMAVKSDGMATPAQPAARADHHYVPKFYLKGFTDKNGSLWVYEKGRNAPRESSPKAEGNQENYYVFSDRGYPDDSAEKVFSKAESVVAPTIRKVGNPQFKMSDRQRSELYTFVALMFVRVPAYREFLDQLMGKIMKSYTQKQASDPEKFAAAMKEFEAKTGESVGDIEKLRKFAASDDYFVKQGSLGYNLGLVFRSGLEISEIFDREFNHDLYYAAPGTMFMTCDNPIVTFEPDIDGRAWVGMGVGRPRTEVIFPLNKRVCLIMSRKGRGAKEVASPLRSRQINDMVMAASQKFAYASEGTRRIARIFNERGCSIKYGENAFLGDPPPIT
jgi:hypothetical protein